MPLAGRTGEVCWPDAYGWLPCRGFAYACCRALAWAFSSVSKNKLNRFLIYDHFKLILCLESGRYASVCVHVRLERRAASAALHNHKKCHLRGTAPCSSTFMLMRLIPTTTTSIPIGGLLSSPSPMVISSCV